MLLFRKKPLEPLERAFQLIEEAHGIVMNHLRDKKFLPSQEEAQLLSQIESAFHHNSAMTAYVLHCLKQRQKGEPEGSPKWRDPKVFDYHYPP